MVDDINLLPKIIKKLLVKNEKNIRKNITGFFTFLKENEMIINDIQIFSEGTYWRADCDVSYEGKRVCVLEIYRIDFIIKIVGDYSTEYSNIPIDEHMKKIVWKHILECGYPDCTFSNTDCYHSNRSGLGKRKTIFDREFDDVCYFSIIFDEMNTENFECIKKLLEMRKTDILIDKKLNQYLDFG